MYNFTVLIVLSRCLRAISCEDESKSVFLIGANSNTNSYIYQTTFDNETKKLAANELISYDTFTEEMINNVVDIYYNNPEKTNSQEVKFYTQVYNQTQAEYQLKMHCKNESKFQLIDIPACNNETIFDVKLNEENNLFLLKNTKISKVDLIRPAVEATIINLNSGSNNNTSHVKICSDICKLDINHIAMGCNTDLFYIDLGSGKIINKVENAHFNGILALEFDPFNSFNFATSGMDYSIKLWDTRNLSCPIFSVVNSTHWIWDCKFNKQFSRVMINCSSSSIVRGLIFDKMSDDFDSEKEQEAYNSINFTNNSTIDYIEFDDSVYSIDWSLNDPWIFAAVSYNSYVYINSIPEEIKYKIMLDN